MPDHRLPDPVDPTAISPKVLVALLVGLGLTGLTAVLSAITPDMLSALGPFALPVALGIAAVAQGLAGYLKRDPARFVLPAPEAEDALEDRAAG
ncbi:hypothetical protein SEA_ALTADENA_29 [Arthrobacter phage Altadena]|uniref:Uncharacterized protein n=1 Tax=Arthrobacter phage Altadena TaxID=3059064 RepID=A0AA96HUF9_9CAUD|nr:hypothetical protein SEA_ALTADENA_29 [Arthrobacter phage Altadena]